MGTSLGTFGIGSPFTQQTPWGVLPVGSFGAGTSFSANVIAQPLQQIVHSLAAVPYQLQQLLQAGYAQQQYIHQLLQIVPAQLQQLHQLIQYLPLQMQQQLQQQIPLQQWGQVTSGVQTPIAGFGASYVPAISSPFQPTHVM